MKREKEGTWQRDMLAERREKLKRELADVEQRLEKEEERLKSLKEVAEVVESKPGLVREEKASGDAEVTEVKAKSKPEKRVTVVKEAEGAADIVAAK